MPFKINISQKNGKSFKLEIQSEVLDGRKIGEKISGRELSSNLEGYEFVISGASDIAGFPHKFDIEGPDLKKVLLTKGWGMHTKKPGIRRKKTVRGKQLSDKTVQINMTIKKEGSKKLSEIFPDQNKAKEEPIIQDSKEKKPAEEKPSDVKAEDKVKETKEKVAEEISEEVEEEIKETIPESPETKTQDSKAEAAEKISEEIKENLEEVSEEIAKKEEN